MTSTATLRYQKQWRLERGRGLYRTVTADTVREHLRDLLRGEASFEASPRSVVSRPASWPGSPAASNPPSPGASARH